ncbi:hypothetical protein COCNU_scaffold002500G000010 [Cocos nucifera]|nr:hypothetical protein [Cocos nucifera]
MVALSTRSQLHDNEIHNFCPTSISLGSRILLLGSRILFRCHDILVGDESIEDVVSNGIEAGLDLVDGVVADGYASVVRVGVRKADMNGGVGMYGSGVDGEEKAIVTEKEAEGADLEEELDDGIGGGNGEHLWSMPYRLLHLRTSGFFTSDKPLWSNSASALSPK